MRENGNKAPPAPQGWKSVRQLDSEGVAGGIHLIRSRLEKLKEDLTDRFVSEGLTEREAIARIESEFIGVKSRPGGGAYGLYASPDALAMANLKCTLPRVASTWRSANQLVHRREAKGSVLAVKQKLKTLREELIRDAVAKGSSENEATATVDRDLVGYRNTGLGSQEALYASPDALRMLQDKGVLVRPAHDPERGR
jgi:hypothetical protein